MFEEKNFKNILADMLAAAPTDIDTECGSIFYDAVAPVAAELSKLYAVAASVADDAFPDTASESALLRHASSLGVERIPATSTVIRGQFDIQIPEGAKFALGEYTYTRGKALYEAEGYYIYSLICDTAGAEASAVRLGSLTPLSYIEGLGVAEAISVISLGENEEDMESLRRRVTSAMTNISYGGNIADYKNAVSAMDNVGGVKVYPAWDGGGTVKIVVQDVGGAAPDEYTVTNVKTLLDPDGEDGNGVGIAPIGHKVTVEGVTEYSVSVQTSLTYADGWDSESAIPHITDAVKTYISKLASKWSVSDALTIRISLLESYILSSGCVDDVSNTKLYDTASGGYTASNITLGENVVPVFGEVTEA